MLHEDVASILNNTIQSVSKSFEYNSEKEFINDSSGRPHFRTPTTGLSLIVLRPQKFQSSNIEAHLHDLSALFQCRRNDKRNCVLWTVDGGPNWSKTYFVFIKNIFCFYKYWQKDNFDLLTVTSEAAGFSAYNSIEHLWALVSKKLTGVKGNPCADGDDVAPALLPKSTKEEILKKEIEVFDRIREELISIYLKDFTYDDFSVHVENIECQANLQKKTILKNLLRLFKQLYLKQYETTIKTWWLIFVIY